MAVTQFGIVYSTGNLHVRRWLFLDDDSSFNDSTLLLLGESLQLMPVGATYANAASYLATVLQEGIPPDQWVAQQEAALSNALGKPLGDPYCAVVNTLGQVVAVIMADPAIDSYHPDPTAQLISDPTHTVGIGWTWNQLTGFVAPLPLPTGPPHLLPVGVGTAVVG
jgi:hypothetical protein